MVVLRLYACGWPTIDTIERGGKKNDENENTKIIIFESVMKK